MTKQSDTERAAAEAAQARVKAVDTAAEADQVDAGKSKARVAAEQAAQDADDAQAKAAELGDRDIAASQKPMTVAEAGVLAVVDPALMAGDHRAQKFGNDPANPKPAPGVDMGANLVKLSRKTPDIPGDGLAFCEVPKEMVGDYLRAGWNVA